MPEILVNSLKKAKLEAKQLNGFNENYFVAGDAFPISSNALADRKNTNCENAGVKQIRLHDLRHSCASLLINKGTNIQVIAKYLGHTKIEETLKTYSHLFISTLDEIINVIYQLRYYRRLNIAKKTIIEDYEEIDFVFNKVLRKAITMLCKLGGMKIITIDIKLNFEIIKYILDTKIINLEQIKMAFATDVDALLIRVYDKNIYEKQGRKRLDVSKLSLEVKTGHKMKLFS